MNARIFAGAMLVAAGLVAAPEAGLADFRVCNNARFPTFSAVAYEDKDKGFATFGWFEIKRLSCETLVAGSLKGKAIYHMAEQENAFAPGSSTTRAGGVLWWFPQQASDQTLCVGKQHREVFAIFKNNVRGPCETAGYGERRFNKKSNGDVEDATWTMAWNVPLSAAEEKEMAAKDYFWECDGCPKTMVVPPGEFMMGSVEYEAGRRADEGPRHKVSLGKPFAFSERWVSRAEYEKFIEQTDHAVSDKCWVPKDGTWTEEAGRSFRNPGFAQDRDNPVVCVSLDDARAYIAWLSKQTGKTYRLPSEAEWEYAIRGGTATPFWWGGTVSTAQANYNGNLVYAGGATGEFRQRTIFAGLKANPWGLFGLGNAAEWTADCWVPSYGGAPADGSARTGGTCGSHAVRGGSWASDPASLRAAARMPMENGTRRNDVGFRVARTLIEPAPAAAPPAPVQLSFWHLTNAKVIDGLVADFNKAHPDIQVTALYSGDYGATDQKIREAKRTGSLPDVAVMGFVPTAEPLGIQPLDELIASSGGKQFLDRFWPSMLLNCVHNGKVYGLPFNRSTPVMYYNKDAFAEVGLDPEKPPLTWDELMSAAQKLTRREGDRITRFGVTLPLDSWLYYALVFANGGEVLSADGTKVLWDQRQNLEALQFWDDLINKHKVAPGNATFASEQDFVAGKTAILWSSTAALPMVRQRATFRWGLARIPRRGEFGPPSGGGDIVLFATDPAKRKAAWTFMTWMTDAPQAARFGIATGYVATNIASWDRPEMQALVKERPDVLVTKEQAKDARKYPSSPKSGPAGGILNALLKDVLINRAPLEAAVRKAVENANAAMAR
jgi:sn-glycerol 3-phosphate transport system substrate-binding protein